MKKVRCINPYTIEINGQQCGDISHEFKAGEIYYPTETIMYKGQPQYVFDNNPNGLTPYASRFEVVDDEIKSISELFEKKVKQEQGIFEVGDKVYYFLTKIQNGIVKSFNDNGEPFVVYHCADDWENYRNYTGILTDRKHLKHGWYELHNQGGPSESTECQQIV